MNLSLPLFASVGMLAACAVGSTDGTAPGSDETTHDAAPMHTDALVRIDAAGARPDVPANVSDDVVTPVQSDASTTPPNDARVTVPDVVVVVPPADASVPAPDVVVIAPPDASAGGTVSPACTAALASETWNFENGAQGWTHAATDGIRGTSWPLDEWAVSVPATSAGPRSCHGGNQCWGTNPQANYAQCERAALKSPAINLSACAPGGTVRVSFWQFYSFVSGTYAGHAWADGGTVEISGDNGTTWTAAALSYTGTIAPNANMGSGYSCLSPTSFYANGKAGFVGSGPTGWSQVAFTVPTALRTAQFMVRFLYASGVSTMTTDANTSRAHTSAGWYLDDVTVTAE